jgi:plasmid maintenance system antidote protein VapI
MGKEIHPNDIWSKEKVEGLKAFIAAHSQELSKEQYIENEFLRIQYELEDYVNGDHSTDESLNALYFIQKYIKVLGVTQKALAEHFDMQDSNLHNCLTGKRRIGKELARKLGACFNHDAKLWILLDYKNYLNTPQEKDNITNKYHRYNYQNLMRG